jgi:DNA mismatch repair protein MutL
MEEFFRVALVNPDINFTMFNNDKILFQLPPSNLKQRIVNLYGPPYGQRLIPLAQETGLVNITGFIGKPEFAKKTRGEQYFFTNGRYIRNPYLNHSVENAFHELIPGDTFPTYFIYLEVDPQTIDINIHPTKTEINFQDARSIYAILNSAVKQAIGRFNLSPTLDFETEKSFDMPPIPKDRTIDPPTIKVNPEYNPFEKQVRTQLEFPYQGMKGGDTDSWKRLLDPLKNLRPGTGQTGMNEPPGSPSLLSGQEDQRQPFIQLLSRYIITQTSKGIVVIDQQSAHERILYERYLSAMEGKQVQSQRLLIPLTIHVSPDDEHLVEELTESFGKSGFEITAFGNATFLVHAVPPGIGETEAHDTIEGILEDYKRESNRSKQQVNTRIARSMAMRTGIKAGKRMQDEEMASLVSELFACQAPESSPDGKPTMLLLSAEELSKKFKTEIKL